MSTEAVDRIIKEAKALTPDERRELIDRLAHEEQNSHEQLGLRNLPGSYDSTLPSVSNGHEGITVKTTLRDWLSKARNMRTELPLTSDSVEILRELREVRSRQ